AFLLWEGQGVVDLAADAGAFEVREDAVARFPSLGEPDDVLVIDVAPPRQLLRQDDALVGGLREQAPVDLRVAPPSLVPRLEVRQLDVENRRLERVDAEVAADVVVKVLR